MGLFDDCGVIVALDASEAREKLIRALIEQGAKIISDSGETAEETGDPFYILEAFDGPLFEDLRKRGKRILGTQCVYDSIQKGKTLPKAEYPIFSRALEGMKFCCTGTAKARIEILVQYMFGIYQPEISVDTNYLIATDTTSLKYQFAVKRGILVVRPTWLNACWQSRSLVEVKNFVLPPFAGCVISVTGLGTGMRNMIQQLVQIFGGQFSPNLNRRCTHLIANSPTGVKYKYARSWRIPIITVEWLFECLKINACAPTENFRPPSVGSLLFPGLSESNKRPFDSLLSSSKHSPSSKSPEMLTNYILDDLEKMVEVIDNITERAVNVQNACDMLMKASADKHDNLRSACINIILEQYEAVQSTEGYARLSEHLKKELEEAAAVSPTRSKRRRVEFESTTDNN